MMVVALAFYGMATFEGPMLSVKVFNSLSHYTEWTIAHVHAGALGWNGMITFAAVYYLVPRLWGRPRLYSLRMVNWHFWLATLGIVFYAASMWVAGIMQGLMWREYGADGYLVYSFSETVAAMHPLSLNRAWGCGGGSSGGVRWGLGGSGRDCLGANMAPAVTSSTALPRPSRRCTRCS